MQRTTKYVGFDVHEATTVASQHLCGTRPVCENPGLRIAIEMRPAPGACPRDSA